MTVMHRQHAYVATHQVRRGRVHESQPAKKTICQDNCVQRKKGGIGIEVHTLDACRIQAADANVMLLGGPDSCRALA